jgi:hypothetical protein
MNPADNDMFQDLLAEVGKRKDAFEENRERIEAAQAAAIERAREENAPFHRSLIRVVN